MGAEAKGWNQVFFFFLNRLHLELLVQSLEKDKRPVYLGAANSILTGMSSMRGRRSASKKCFTLLLTASWEEQDEHGDKS